MRNRIIKYVLLSFGTFLFSHVISQTISEYPICYWNKQTDKLDSVLTISGSTNVVTKHVFTNGPFDETKVEKLNQIEIGIKNLGMYLDKLKVCRYDSLPIVVYNVFLDSKKNILYYVESKNHLIKNYSLSAALKFYPDSLKHVDIDSNPVERNCIINEHIKQFFCGYTAMIGIHCVIGYKENDRTINKNGIFHMINWKKK